MDCSRVEDLLTPPDSSPWPMAQGLVSARAARCQPLPSLLAAGLSIIGAGVMCDWLRVRVNFPRQLEEWLHKAPSNVLCVGSDNPIGVNVSLGVGWTGSGGPECEYRGEEIPET